MVVATPGRLIDLLEMGSISLKKVEVMVFDEADRMLDMGFAPEIDKILTYVPEKEKRQTMLFTATWPKSIVEEKFGKQIFGYLARCEGKFCTTTLKFLKIKPKSTKMNEKCSQNLKIGL